MKIDLKNKYQLTLIVIVSVVCFMSAMVLLSPYTQNPQNKDTDKDTITDANDNCPTIPNSDQSDVDTDGIGDVCDTCTDTDKDGYGNPGFQQNTCPLDNCPDTPNTNQTDTDQDLIGDACDTCPNDPLNDEDGDDICGSIDNCPSAYNPTQEDADSDGIGDACELPPKADFTITPQEPIHGETIQFFDTSAPGGGALQQWHWSFGDNNTASEQNPTHTYQNIGEYNLQLIVTDINGKTNFKTQTITIIDNEPPSSPLITGPTLGIAGTNYTYHLLATDPDGNKISYEFDWGDHTTQTLGLYDSGAEAQGTHQWKNAGRYVLQVQTKDIHSTTSDLSFLIVRIYDLYILHPFFIDFFEQNHQILFFRVLYL
jgi:PKD repeat protein